MKENIDFSLLPFWGNLTVDEQSLIHKNTRVVEYQKGNNVHSSDKCTGVILIRSGTLRVYLLSQDGREITLYRLYSGEICIMSAPCILSDLDLDVFVDAEEDSQCLLLPSAVFMDIANNNVYAKNYALQTAVDRFSDVLWSIQQILFMKIDKRLAIFLWDELLRTNNNIITLTHEQIAKYIGSAREVVSRMLKYFESEKIVELSRKGVKILDKNALKQLAIND